MQPRVNESCSPSPEAQLDSRRCRRRASAAVIEFVTTGSGCEERRVVDFLRAPPLLRGRLAFRAVPLRADAFFPALFFLAAIILAPLTVSRRSIPCGTWRASVPPAGSPAYAGEVPYGVRWSFRDWCRDSLHAGGMPDHGPRGRVSLVRAQR